MMDYITAQERLRNPYKRRILIDAALFIATFGLGVFFVYQTIVDIISR